MSDTPSDSRDYRETVFLPETDLPMRASLPKREPEFLKKWENEDLYAKLRASASGRPMFILHDGPPYANGDIHTGHALNKTLKDVIVKSQQMLGKNAPYVPGWDCHGLPIEWKIEEKYRKKKKNKDEVDPVEFRRECRDFASHWVGVQKEQFQRLGIFGDWENPYLTMNYEAEARIVEEILKFRDNGSLYLGSKPVMWSPVEKTALAEAEVEYADHRSTQIDVAFSFTKCPDPRFDGADIVIWTTTPWTIPGNRAVCYGADIDYVLLTVDAVSEDAHVVAGRRFLVAEALVGDFTARAGITDHTVSDPFKGALLEGGVLAHPWRGMDGAEGYYDFDVPLLDGDHVTTDAGTGFVHTAPGHGQEDYEVATLKYGIPVPHTVDEDGRYFPNVALMQQGHVYKVADHVCDLLIRVTALVGKHALVHSYPHSWRSKAPLIFRNTSQWFISMDKTGLRDRALKAIREEVNWVPARSKNRIESMVSDRPDWVISRQRAWGVPITLFVHKESGEILRDKDVDARIIAAVTQDGADAWVARPASDFLGDAYSADDYDQIQDVVDVWFDSGSTHAFVLEDRDDLQSPADLYLEGSDQHRGWFQSSLMESCGTRDKAPYKAVLTHGFTMAADGRKMSKSIGNTVDPLKVIQQYGADILRLWVVSVDYTEDHRIGDEIIKGQVDAYRKIRNTVRYMLGNLAGFTEAERLDVHDMPELERYMLHKLAKLDALVRDKANSFDFNAIFQALYQFCIGDLSAFYFDIRKDALYCDTPTDVRRRAARTVLDILFRHLVTWFAPILSFTAEEAWMARHAGEAESVHLQVWAEVPADWQDAALAEKWDGVRRLRRVITGALEVDRREKRIGSSLQASVVLTVENQADADLFADLDLAEISITSSASVTVGRVPGDAFTLDDVSGVGAVTALAQGDKCERCWVINNEVTQHGSLCHRCQGAVQAFDLATGRPAL